MRRPWLATSRHISHCLCSRTSTIGEVCNRYRVLQAAAMDNSTLTGNDSIPRDEKTTGTAILDNHGPTTKYLPRRLVVVDCFDHCSWFKAVRR